MSQLFLVFILVISGLVSTHTSPTGSTSRLGGKCTVDADCLYSKEKCDTTSQKCVCADGYYSEDNQCKAVLGGICANDEDCSPVTERCDLSNKKCVCADRYYPENNRCKGGVGEICETDRDCFTRTERCDARTMKCICAEGYYPEGYECKAEEHYKSILILFDLGLGGSCAADVDCLIKKEKCDSYSHKCICADGYFAQGDQCRAAILGITCTTNNDCHGINNSRCINSKCSCPEGYKGSDDMKQCLLRKLGDAWLGGICYTNEDCLFGTEECDTSMIRCVCAQGYFPQGDQCKAGFGGRCDADEDCLFGTEKCDSYSQKCICADGYFPQGDQCRADPFFCLSHENCKNNVTHWCNDAHICSCREGYEARGNDCAAPLNEPCLPDEGCIDPEADCSNFYCKCRSGLEPSGGRCIDHHGTHIHLEARGNGEISVELDIEEN
ncbi:hypothetical protein J437_LFUL017438 [Ladona fulva]|uniref:EGF-like domain-containing protein n=1 Tax=Ladona fulva TaxID=123851 RepID=A0A8K0KLA8_LADFU|nr:hypothetical protein J437_LFUL017438 [Ladona fulva]